MTRSNQFFAILKKITTTKSTNFLSPNGQDFYVRFLFWVLYYDLNPIHPFFSKLPDFFGMLLIHWYQHSWAAQHIVSLNPNFFKPILENESCLWLSKKKIRIRGWKFDSFEQNWFQSEFFKNFAAICSSGNNSHLKENIIILDVSI